MRADGCQSAGHNRTHSTDLVSVARHREHCSWCVVGCAGRCGSTASRFALRCMRACLFSLLDMMAGPCGFNSAQNNVINTTHCCCFCLLLRLLLPAAGDATSAVMAPPYSTTVTLNLWAVYCNRQGCCKTFMRACCTRSQGPCQHSCTSADRHSLLPPCCLDKRQFPPVLCVVTWHQLLLLPTLLTGVPILAWLWPTARS